MNSGSVVLVHVDLVLITVYSLNSFYSAFLKLLFFSSLFLNQIIFHIQKLKKKKKKFLMHPWRFGFFVCLFFSEAIFAKQLKKFVNPQKSVAFEIAIFG